MERQRLSPVLASIGIGLLASGSFAQVPPEERSQVAVYTGAEGPGVGRHIVLVSGDEEYRSEEALPELGKILALHHGFTCTVLFAVDPATGEINPDVRTNIPGLAALDEADLMIISTRFRDLPDEQMEHIDRYLKAGGPVIGLRTATHAFAMDSSPTYASYTWNSPSGGFGREILGETWVAHHGDHGHQSTRGVLAPEASALPLARGLAPGSVWAKTDVYAVRLPLPEGCRPFMLGQVLAGMAIDDEPVAGEKNDPMMPVAWTREFPEGSGKPRRVFATTMGAAVDLETEGTRRMLVNAVYWTLGMEDQIPPDGTAVDLVGEYQPSPFAFGGYKKGVKPTDHALRQDAAPLQK
ncbi:MAG: ThuA domain-containing protein [Phycisphaerales bacterium]|nr:ThuA domain-containing protein [Phycisphaerales bacterium]